MPYPLNLIWLSPDSLGSWFLQLMWLGMWALGAWIFVLAFASGAAQHRHNRESRYARRMRGF